jgi:hypothetical protein
MLGSHALDFKALILVLIDKANGQWSATNAN